MLVCTDIMSKFLGYWCSRKNYFVLLQNNPSQDFRIQIMNVMCHTKHFHQCKLSEVLWCIHYIKQITCHFVMENQPMIHFVVLINTVRVTQFFFLYCRLLDMLKILWWTMTLMIFCCDVEAFPHTFFLLDLCYYGTLNNNRN